MGLARLIKDRSWMPNMALAVVRVVQRPRDYQSSARRVKTAIFGRIGEKCNRTRLAHH